jgi:Cu/Ag efflux pump CusA
MAIDSAKHGLEKLLPVQPVEVDSIQANLKAVRFLRQQVQPPVKARRRFGVLTEEQLEEAIVEGAAKRIRPKFMTFATMCFGLIPVLWSTGTGSEIMKRVAAPMVGGILTSFALELLVYPTIYSVWRQRTLSTPDPAPTAPLSPTTQPIRMPLSLTR